MLCCDWLENPHERSRDKTEYTVGVSGIQREKPLTLPVIAKGLAGRIPQGSQVISLTNVGVFEKLVLGVNTASLLLLLRQDSARLKGGYQPACWGDPAERILEIIFSSLLFVLFCFNFFFFYFASFDFRLFGPANIWIWSLVLSKEFGVYGGV